MVDRVKDHLLKLFQEGEVRIESIKEARELKELLDARNVDYEYQNGYGFVFFRFKPKWKLSEKH